MPMIVEQGKCQIYPEKQDQMCMRIKVLAVMMEPAVEGPGETTRWHAKLDTKTPIRDVELVCGQKGYDRFLTMFDNATAPPTPRPRKPTDRKAAVDMPTIEEGPGDA